MAKLTLDIEEDESAPLELDIEADKPKRKSSFNKQAIASVADLFTEIPGMLGLGGSAVQAGFNYLIDDEDKPFKEHFKTAASTGFLDTTLMNIANKGRNLTNKVLGISEPQSTEGILARNAALFIPIPGMRLAKGASMLSRAARMAMDVTLPTVKHGTKKSMAVRGGIQGGIGLGIDQGVRAMMDDPNLPLLFSDKALSGGVDPLNANLSYEVARSSDLSEYQNAAALTLDIEEDIPLVVEVEDQPHDEFVQDQVATDAKMEKAEQWDDIKLWGIIAGGLIGSFYIANRLKGAKSIEKPVNPSPNTSAGKQFQEDYVDKGKVAGHVFEEMDMDAATRASVDPDAHTDITGMARQSVIEGKHAHGFDNDKWVGHSEAILETDEAVLKQAGKGEIFNDAMMARSEMATVRIGRDRSLWRKNISDTKLDERIAAGHADPEVKALMDKHAQNYRADLENDFYRGAISKEDKDEILEVFGDITKGEEGAYMPFYGVSEVSFTRRMARKFLGINTTKGDQMRTVAEYQARGGGTAQQILTPYQAYGRHRLHNTAYINEELYKNNMLSQMAGVHPDITNAKGYTRFQIVNGQMTKSSKAMDKAHTGRGTRLVAVGHDIKTKPDDILMSTVKDDVYKNADQSINDLRNTFGKDLVTVQHKGKLYAYDVPDAGIRAAMELSPQLGPKLEFMNHWKNVFTKFTTGDYSLFAPISHAFSAQQVASTTVARAGKKARDAGKSFPGLRGAYEGGKSLGRSLGGSKEIFLDQMAGDISNYLMKSIALDKGLGAAIKGVAPQAIERMQARLQKRISSSMLGRVRSETGRTATGIGSTPDSLEDMMQQYGKTFSDFYGAAEMGLVKKAWKAFNNAANEGPAYAVMLKELDGIANPSIKVLRKAVDLSKDLAGDMSRRGASQVAKGVNASIPFSSAMIQSWNALGSAAKHDWRSFSVGVGALIGAPTLIEMTMNAAISQAFPEGFPDRSGNGKMWTYDDYYWNGYTTQQRTDNMIIFIPGRPPWEAIIMPISPEWGLFRSVVMEGADALFNFSRTGAIEIADQGRDKVGRDHFLGALHRVLDIPLPPLGAAALSAMGIDQRAGLSLGEGDPEAPSPSLNFFESLPIGTGERITGRMGRSKDVNGSLDKSTAAWIKDIFGAGGTAYVAVYEAINAGSTNVGGSIGQGLSQGVDALLDSGMRQMRYAQPLFGKVFKPNASGEIASTLHNKRQALLSLGKDADILAHSKGVIQVDGKWVIADTVVPTQDPIRQDLAKDAGFVKSSIGMLDKTINYLREQISAAALSTDFKSYRERQDFIDGKNMEIEAYKAQQLGALHEFEDLWSTMLSEKYGRNININLSGGIGSTIGARPNLTNSGELTLPK